MRVIALVLLLPGFGWAQSFDAAPLLQADGAALTATLTDECVNALVDRDPTALVTAAARDCIGLSADSAAADPVTGARLEERYWQWRIAQNYQGLAAWVADKPQTEQIDSLRASVANPAAATANVPLECALRVGQQNMPRTAAKDTARCEMRETALIALELEFTVRQACQDPGTGAFAAFCGQDTQ